MQQENLIQAVEKARKVLKKEVIPMKNKLRIVAILLVVTVLTVGVALFNTALAHTPVPINQIFPDPVLANLVAINLNLGVTDRVVDEQLEDIFVINLNHGGQVTDFTGIERLRNLEHLYADFHGLTSLEPFASLTNLRVLDIQGNYISDLSPLVGMSNLEDVRLYGNPISSFAGVAGVTSLILTESNFDDLSAIADLNQLVELMIVNIDLSAADLAILASLTNLRSLTLRNMELDDLSFVVNLLNLEELELLTNFHIEDLTPLSGLTNLRRLSVINSQITDVAPLSVLVNLDYLNLTGNRVTDIRPLSTLNAIVEMNDQWMTLPYIGIDEELPFVVYGLDSTLPLTFVIGTGEYQDGVVVWHEAGFNEFAWNSNNGAVNFNGFVLQEVWAPWDEYIDDDLAIDWDSIEPIDCEPGSEFYDTYCVGYFDDDYDWEYEPAVTYDCEYYCDYYEYPDEFDYHGWYEEDLWSPDDNPYAEDFEYIYDDYENEDDEFEIVMLTDVDDDTVTESGTNIGANTVTGPGASADITSSNILSQTGVTVVAVLGIGIALVVTGIGFSILKRKSETNCGD